MRSHRYAVSGTRPRGGRPSARLGRSVLDARSPFYRFETFDVEDGHGGRSRMRIGIPRTRPPRRGFPALWMLDGNRALAQFDHAWLQGLAAAPTPRVLVFVAPDNDLLVDLPRRAHDCTFQTADHRFLAAPKAPPGPVGGGADALLEVLTGQAMPALARRVPLDRERHALWGHSLAGLFVLHALYSGRGPFTEYAAASPSLWWSQGALLGDPEQRFSREGWRAPCACGCFSAVPNGQGTSIRMPGRIHTVPRCWRPLPARPQMPPHAWPSAWQRCRGWRCATRNFPHCSMRQCSAPHCGPRCNTLRACRCVAAGRAGPEPRRPPWPARRPCPPCLPGYTRHQSFASCTAAGALPARGEALANPSRRRLLRR